MAPISLDQLYQVIEKQDVRIAQLQNEIEKLKAWSDLSDHYLQDMIDNNSSSIDRLRTVINEMHEANEINDRIEQLEEEDSLPVAQLLLTFIENNATEEQKEEMRHPNGY
jgi:uncharacterized small protein (DUF1192 family)